MEFHLQYADTVISNSWVIISIIATSTLVIWISWRYERRQISNGINTCLLIGYVFLVLSVTVFCRPDMGSHQFAINPQSRYVYYFTTLNIYHKHQIIEEILLNITMFIPIGILLTNLRIKINFVLLIGNIISCLIEILQ